MNKKKQSDQKPKKKQLSDDSTSEDTESQSDNETEESICASSSSEDDTEEKTPVLKKQKTLAPIRKPPPKRVKKIASVYHVNALLMGNINLFRNEQWEYRVSATVRWLSRTFAAGPNTSTHVQAKIEWLKHTSRHVKDEILVDALLLVAHIARQMSNNNDLKSQAVSFFVGMYIALGAPLTLQGIEWYETMLTLMPNTTEDHSFFFEVIKFCAADDQIRKLHGVTHVFLRLMSRCTNVEAFYSSYERLNKISESQLLLTFIRTADDVRDLVQLGFEPNPAMLVEFAHTHHFSEITNLIYLVFPYLWKETMKTFPHLKDSPYDPSRATTTLPCGPPMSSYFFMPQTNMYNCQYWIDSYSQLIRTAPHLLPVGGVLPAVTGILEEMDPLDRQLLLSVIHKSPSLLRYAFATKTSNLISHIQLFQQPNWDTLFQVLLQPPHENPACTCVIQKIQTLYTAKTTARHPHQNFDTSSGAHTCPGELLENTDFSCLIRRTRGLCLPWNRPAPISSSITTMIGGSKFGVTQLEMTLLGKAAIANPYSLNFIGRAVAISHLFALLYWRRVATTTVLVAGDVIVGWVRRPTEKDIRAAMTLISQLKPPANDDHKQLEKEKTETRTFSANMMTKNSSPITDYLKSLHVAVMRYYSEVGKPEDKSTQHSQQDVKIMIQLYQHVEETCCG